MNIFNYFRISDTTYLETEKLGVPEKYYARIFYSPSLFRVEIDFFDGNVYYVYKTIYKDASLDGQPSYVHKTIDDSRSYVYKTIDAGRDGQPLRVKELLDILELIL